MTCHAASTDLSRNRPVAKAHRTLASGEDYRAGAFGGGLPPPDGMKIRGRERPLLAHSEFAAPQQFKQSDVGQSVPRSQPLAPIPHQSIARPAFRGRAVVNGAANATSGVSALAGFHP